MKIQDRIKSVLVEGVHPDPDVIKQIVSQCIDNSDTENSPALVSLIQRVSSILDKKATARTPLFSDMTLLVLKLGIQDLIDKIDVLGSDLYKFKAWSILMDQKFENKTLDDIEAVIESISYHYHVFEKGDANVFPLEFKDEFASIGDITIDNYAHFLNQIRIIIRWAEKNRK